MIALCALDAIAEGRARSFSVGETSLFALKRDGVVYAYHNSCPHLGIELNWQGDEFFDRDGELLQCATHGALFVPETGRCIAGPCHDEHLRPVPIQIRAGTVYAQI